MQSGASLRVLAVQASLLRSLLLQAVSRRAHQGESNCIIELTYLRLHCITGLSHWPNMSEDNPKGPTAVQPLRNDACRGDMLSMHAAVE